MSPQFRVTLTKEEVEELQKISSTGSRSAKIVLFVDFSHYFRWLFANFRECSLIS